MKKLKKFIKENFDDEVELFADEDVKHLLNDVVDICDRKALALEECLLFGKTIVNNANGELFNGIIAIDIEAYNEHGDELEIEFISCKTVDSAFEVEYFGIVNDVDLYKESLKIYADSVDSAFLQAIDTIFTKMLTQ